MNQELQTLLKENEDKFDLVFDEDGNATIRWTDLKVVGIASEQDMIAVIPYFAEKVETDDLCEATTSLNLITVLSEHNLNKCIENPKWVIDAEDDEFGGNLVREFAEKKSVLVFRKRNREDLELIMEMI